jgi:DNA-directed RNA polymerase specialized sigma24 family protein
VLHAFGLRPALRDVFLLCDIQGVTIAEAAAILNISPAVVATRLVRARREVNALVESEC